MGKTRLEAFSDGVIAIIITIMVLELKVPHDPSPAALAVPLALAGLTALAGLLYVLVAVMWLVPDRRIERALGDSAGH